ncbi:hypothetical protein GCM10022223_24260 [Kineosporia mesophila]|uniref:Uncharacterized protein n=1 Tax=Kineosporia mesophila TaxID=566012 RepID=A0ABP6ZH88_9ACTN
MDTVVPEYPDDTAEAFLRRIGFALERGLHTVLGPTRNDA